MTNKVTLFGINDVRKNIQEYMNALNELRNKLNSDNDFEELHDDITIRVSNACVELKALEELLKDLIQIKLNK